METNPLLSAFATALFLALATPACATSLEPTQPQVPAAYVLPAAADEAASPAEGSTRPPFPAVIRARVFGESPAGSTPPVAVVPFLAPDPSHAGADPCRLVELPEVASPVDPTMETAPSAAARSSTLASGADRAAVGDRPKPPTVTVTGFRGRAPVDIAWAFPVPPSRDGGPPPAAPTGKTLVQMALFDAAPSPDAKPRSVLQCTSEIDSIAWVVPRAMVDRLVGEQPRPGTVVRVSVARAPGRLVDMPERTGSPPFAVGAFVDLPVARDGSLSRR